MAQEPPEPPVLSFGARGLVVEFVPPRDAANAAIYLHVEGGAKLYYCPAAKSFVADGASNKMPKLNGVKEEIVVKKGLGEGKVSATIRYRARDEMGCGPESPHSNTCHLARPAKPCAPQVTPVWKDQVHVEFALPALSSKASVKVEEGEEGEKKTIYRVERPQRKRVQLRDPPYIVELQIPAGAEVGDTVRAESMPTRGTVLNMKLKQEHLSGVLVEGLSSPLNTYAQADEFGQGSLRLTLPASEVEYHISVAASNGVAWSGFGDATIVRLANHFPKAPCAPTLTEIGEDRVRVNFTRPPDVFFPAKMKVVMRVVPGGPVLYYNGDGGLICTTDANFNEKTCQLDSARVKSCVVGGLAPNTEYEVNVLSVNDVGEGPASAPTRFKTLPSDVEITGVQTQDERDEEAKKHAVDVDAADEPAAKRAKSES
jgi:hypothetical protein